LNLRPGGLRIASYNIHRALGRDGRLAPGRVADVIRALDADVVALQEVETPLVSAPAALLGRLADAGYEPLLGPTITSDRHSYGNVLLTRLPVLTCSRVDISVALREPRGLIDARLALPPAAGSRPSGDPSAALRCLATHLGLNAAERRRQIECIAEQIDSGRDDGGHRQTPTILLGDFNEWWPRRRLKPIDNRLQRTPAHATWPSRWPLLALDRIWYGGALRLEWMHVASNHRARLASDHLPLVAGFVLVPGSETKPRTTSGASNAGRALHVAPI
jgi:endonuclease/exonuclease/phosphatase family metal-dependent hydrolase